MSAAGRQEHLHEERAQTIVNQCSVRMKQNRGCFVLWVRCKDASLCEDNFIFPARGWSHKLSAITIISTTWPGPMDPNSELAGVWLAILRRTERQASSLPSHSTLVISQNLAHLVVINIDVVLLDIRGERKPRQTSPSAIRERFLTGGSGPAAEAAAPSYFGSAQIWSANAENIWGLLKANDLIFVLCISKTKKSTRLTAMSSLPWCAMFSCTSFVLAQSVILGADNVLHLVILPEFTLNVEEKLVIGKVVNSSHWPQWDDFHVIRLWRVLSVFSLQYLQIWHFVLRGGWYLLRRVKSAQSSLFIYWTENSYSEIMFIVNK